MEDRPSLKMQESLELKAELSEIEETMNQQITEKQANEINYAPNQPAVISANGSNVNEIRKTPFIISLREWEGYVVEITNDSFIAKLVNVKNKSELAKESGKFKISMLSTDDQNELQLGSRIRWTIDLEISRSGSRQNVSKVELLDTPEITEEVIENAYKKAAEMAKRIRLNEVSK